MAKRKLPPRYKTGPKKGQFKPKSARRSKSSTKRRRRRSTARRNPGRTTRKRRRTYKRNPKRMAPIQAFTDGVVEAGQILIGKAAVRSIPDIVNLPKEGNVGLAIQAGTALAIGYLTDMFLSRDASRAMTAGALTAPLETLIVSYNVPWLAPALSPVSQANGLNAYVRGGGLPYARARQALPAAAGSGMARATATGARGLGRYATERGAPMSYDD